MSERLVINGMEALELLSWGKVRKASQMVISEKLFEKLSSFVFQDTSTVKFCEYCKNGNCMECINFVAKKDICKCEGVYHSN